MERQPRGDMDSFAGVLDRRIDASLTDALVVPDGVPVVSAAFVAVPSGHRQRQAARQGS